jgi:hypothetical protein
MTDPTKPFHNTTTQREKAEILRNDRANTYAGRAQTEADEIQGRFAQEHKATVIGSDGAPDYPQLPENSWTNDPVPPEEPLGIDVNYVEPQGEKFEVEASLSDAVLATPVATPQPTGPSPSASPSSLAKANSEVSDASLVADSAVLHPPKPDVEPALAIPNPKRRE